MFRHLVRRAEAAFDFKGRRGRVVDFGCSYGHLGMLFQAAGWEVIGVDRAPRIVAYHRAQGTFPAYSDLDVPDIPDGSVDVIAAIDVLCYLEDPIHFLRLAHRKLATPGVVLLRVPNRNQYLRALAAMQRVLPVNLLRRVECDHKSYWSAKTVRYAAKEAGFDEVRILRRERGYWYPPLRKALHGITQFVSYATGGLVDLGTVFHAELWERPPSAG